MARTRHQQPTLKRDAANKRFEARYREDEIQNDGTITRPRRKVYFPFAQYPTEKLAQKALNELLNPINKISYKPRRMATFGEYVQTWRETILPHYALSTQASHQSHLDNYLLPAFKDRVLETIDTEAVQAWVTANKNQLDPVYLDHIYATLRAVLKIARRDKYIETNPCCADIVLPSKPEAGEGTYAYTIADYHVMKSHMSDQNALIFRLQAETGIRPGEVAALKVDCLEVNGSGVPMLTVKENFVNLEGGQFKETKNGKKRYFPISVELDQELRRHLRLKNRTEGLIFTTRNGRPLDTSNFNRMLRAVAARTGVLAKVQAMGIDKLGTYPLRRMVSTEAGRERLPEKTRSKRMGHTTDMFTVYEKRIEEEDVRFANTLAAKLDNEPAAPAPAPAQPDLLGLFEQLNKLAPEVQAAFLQAWAATRVQNSEAPTQKGPFGSENSPKTAPKPTSAKQLGSFWTPNGPGDGLTN